MMTGMEPAFMRREHAYVLFYSNLIIIEIYNPLFMQPNDSQSYCADLESVRHISIHHNNSSIINDSFFPISVSDDSITLMNATMALHMIPLSLMWW